MFSYPPCPWILTRDNLVSRWIDSPTMPPAAGTGSGIEMVITTEYLAMRLDWLIELLQDCLGDDAGDL
jgi:hypothetical protein